MTNESENVIAIDPLAERIRAAWIEIEGGREQWINGTLKLAAAILESRRQYPVHGDFSIWLERNGLKAMSKDDRSVLVNMARVDQVALRQEMERKALSWRETWKQSALRPGNGALLRSEKGPHSRGKGLSGHRSGHAKRQRAKRIPDVMQERPVRPAIDLKGLSREEIDPDFQGTDLEFATKYGHVRMRTKVQIEADKQQDEVQRWAGAVIKAAQAAQAVPVLSDPASMTHWLKRPAKRAKFDGWLYALETAVARLKALLPPKTLDELEAEMDAIGKPLQ